MHVKNITCEACSKPIENFIVCDSCYNYAMAEKEKFEAIIQKKSQEIEALKVKLADFGQ